MTSEPMPLQLSIQHQALLRERAIPLEFAIAHRLRSVDLGAVKRQELQYKRAKSWPNLPLPPVTGILIPYQRCLDGVERVRVRSDQASYTKPGPELASRQGEVEVPVPRYICQAGVAVVPYIIAEVADVAGDTAIPLYIVEAPLKALALSAHGFLAIGLGGVLAGGHDKSSLSELDEIVAHPELQRIRWKGRCAYIVFDAGLGNDDAPGNPMVALGAARVAKVLSDLGADVRVVEVPYYHAQESDPERGRFWSPRDQGPDDFIHRNGVDAFSALVTAAMPADLVTRLKSAVEGPNAVERAGRVGAELRNLFVQAMLNVADPATLHAVAALTGRAGVTKKGLAEVAAAFGERLARRTKPNAPSWSQELKLTRAGQPRPIRENVELALRKDPGLLDLVAFDEFAQAIVFAKVPPWLDLYSGAGVTRVRDLWGDEDDIRLSGYLAERYDLLDMPPKKVRDAVVVVARDRVVHPVRDYLKSLAWDGVPRVDEWLTRYLGVDPGPYTAAAGRWWIISAVARIMQPGCQVDHVLILEGGQGQGKTSVLRILGDQFFSDADLGDLRSKEAALALQGCWLIELAEGDVFSRASTRALKAFVTKIFDDVIPKYSNLRKRLLRQCVFALTINDEADYLADPTGNRRYLPVTVGTIDLEGLKLARDQVWAEAVQLFRHDAKWWPSTDDERALCQTEQERRQAQDPWDDTIRRELASLEHVTISELLSALDISVANQKRGDQLRAAACLRSSGWIEGTRSGLARTWVRGPAAVPRIVSMPQVEESAMSIFDLDY